MRFVDNKGEKKNFQHHALRQSALYVNASWRKFMKFWVMNLLIKDTVLMSEFQALLFNRKYHS